MISIFQMQGMRCKSLGGGSEEGLAQGPRVGPGCTVLALGEAQPDPEASVS